MSRDCRHLSKQCERELEARQLLRAIDTVQRDLPVGALVPTDP